MNESLQNSVLLEICTASVQDAITAQNAGAARIELNSALPLGGLTPTIATLKAVRKAVSIPVIAMSRPRESGFCYSQLEFQTLADDCRLMLDEGVDGIAFGILDANGQVDAERCSQIVELVGPHRTAVFHRAFDLVDNQVQALEVLVDCGVDRIMTSGGQPSAWIGRDRIARLIRHAGDRIEILAAGGIRQNHVVSLVRETGLGQIHTGLGRDATDLSYSNRDDQVNFFSPPPDTAAIFRESCPESIRRMVACLSAIKGERP